MTMIALSLVSHKFSVSIFVKMILGEALFAPQSVSELTAPGARGEGDHPEHISPFNEVHGRT